MPKSLYVDSLMQKRHNSIANGLGVKSHFVVQLGLIELIVCDIEVQFDQTLTNTNLKTSFKFWIYLITTLN